MTERLIESVNMVKELLQSNRQLREIIDQKSQDCEKSQTEVASLQFENQDLKDKIDVLTRLVRPPNADDVANLDARDLFAEELQVGSTTGGEQLAKEVLDLRRANRALEDRVHQLELRNTQIVKGFSNLGNIEPAKPNFHEQSYTTERNCKPAAATEEWRKRSPLRTGRNGFKMTASKRSTYRSGSVRKPKANCSFYPAEVQVTKNVWAPTTIYAITGGEVPPIRNKSNSNSTRSFEENTKVAAISKLSEILSNRMKLYQGN